MFNQKYRLLIEKIRFRELKKLTKKTKFGLLDLGCGDGLFLKLAQKQGVTTLGIDKLAPASSCTIKSLIEDFKPKQKFDAITMFHVLEHLDSPENVLKTIKHWLEKEGILVIETPLIGNYTEKFLKKNYFAYRDKTHIHLFSKKELIALLKKNGWQIVKKKSALLEFPLTVLTTSIGMFKKNPKKGLVGIMLFLPLKILTIFGLNDEIIRFYCQR